MLKKKMKKTLTARKLSAGAYEKAFSDIKRLIQQARYASVRSVNAIMTATYWEIGRRIVLVEQKGKKRAEYGEELIEKLSKDLTKSCGKGFGKSNLHNFRQFYLSYSHIQKFQTVSGKFKNTRKKQTLPNQLKTFQKSQTLFAKSSNLLKTLQILGDQFPLPWSAYIRLMSVKDKEARKFYEEEALRGGWSIRQLDRQIRTQFYTRTMLSKNKMAMLTKAVKAKPQDRVTPEEAIKDPYVLEFLNLKDEYSENELEEALIQHLQIFLLELGGAFTFIGRQKRLRVGGQWFRVDLIFYHRILRCLIIIDLKVDDFTHADAGQMNMYLNYAKEHWTHKGENPPVGLILCAGKNDTVVEYTLKGLSGKIMTADYMTKLPSKKLLAQEIEKTKKILTLKKAQPVSFPTVGDASSFKQESQNTAQGINPKKKKIYKNKRNTEKKHQPVSLKTRKLKSKNKQKIKKKDKTK